VRNACRRGQIAVVRQDRLQVAPIYVAHREVELSVALAGLVDRDDIRVVESGRQAWLLEKAAPEVLVLPKLGRDQLQSYRALQR